MASHIKFDSDGTLWANINHGYYTMPLGSDDFRHVIDLNPVKTTSVGGRVIALLPGTGFMELSAFRAPRPIRVDEPARYKYFLFNGPHGSLWAARDNGFARMAYRPDGVLQAVEIFANDSRSDGIPLGAFLDREANLWVTTMDGVERYRRHRIHLVDTASDGYYWLAQRGLGDELWLGGESAPLAKMGTDGLMQPMAPNKPAVLYRQAEDHVWVASKPWLWEYHGKEVRRWELPPELAGRRDIQSMSAGSDGQLLVSIIRSGLWRFKEGHWTRDGGLVGIADPTPIGMLTTSSGRVWLGLTGNRLGELTATGFKLLTPDAGLKIGNILSLFEYRGRLLAGGDFGVAWIDGDRAHALQPKRKESFRRNTGMVSDAMGNLWLHGDDGLFRVTAAELERFWRDPRQPVEWDLFNFEDGLHGLAAAIRPLPSLTVANGGRIYYATFSQVGWIDPAAISRNQRPPSVIVEQLRAGQSVYEPANGIQLPERTTAVDIAFTATALSIPERVRLRYRLDGVDADWREVERERSAHYTNLIPGQYRFRVIAANEDGIWNMTGAELRFEIKPSIWQTAWFRALAVLAVLGALVWLYRWRVALLHRRAGEQVAARLDATLNERERIARSLHDNLLQGVQALLLRFQLVQVRLKDEPETQKLLDRALSDAEWLVENTRDEVVALRREPQSSTLLTELYDAVVKVAPEAANLLHLSTAGEPRPLRCEAAEEMFYVLREAVLNSVQHARASRIAVQLRFTMDAVECQVRDDGIGIAPEVAQAGLAGHWGIIGMRERIARIGGEISITLRIEGGVAVRFTLPAGVAYQNVK
ncbi:sensor histidine kinase [Pseudoduganella violacea]|uniref:sensor histidine kinase n=1 Tax=Pseudoduganella violacea TaxID=1715466 RepID=UPI001E516DB8|nr:triple tyrosine motif-containing protein [Pseudoduganella violacea]